MGSAVDVERSEFESRDMGEVHDLISHRYVEHQPRISGGARTFWFASRSVWAAGMTFDRATYRANIVINADPFETTLVLRVREGLFDITAGRSRLVAGPGECVLYPRNIPLDFVMDEVAYEVLQLPGDLTTRAAARLGIDPADFRFESMTPISEAMNQHWRATTSYIAGVFDGPDPLEIHPLLLSAVQEAAVTAVLATFPNTTMTMDYVPGSGWAAPVVVRRAAEFIEAHAAEAITLEDIAAAAGIGTRALHTAFARHLETTPLGYLYRVRLARAHEELLDAPAEGGVTVAGVASRWGFADRGRFAAAYHAMFGELPSRTLRHG
ncbi:AraC family transcriptional regulator [Cryptosporangium sp. NPDC048952]|uniref:AraC family transcriptional regulator n=1 Tax=Cryptosporangium sp. NPDC048952 TaxID=3363961 RepID=UPI0037185CB5